ncbi:MAG: outer membrane beta-barrel protein [Flavobacteriaceae bacterium]|nr:outer membrane beta-barrel protein [Flavobacteriaceae bacterium]
MKNSILLIALMFFSVISYAQGFQNGSLTKNDNTVLNGRIAIDQQTQTVQLKKEYDSQSIDFGSISEVTLRGKKFEKTTFDENTWFLHKVETGKATLYNATQSVFLINHAEKGVQVLDLKNDESQIPGKLAVLFNDCNDIRDQINNTDVISGNRLAKFVKSYNSCSYGDFEPTVEEIKKAKLFNSDQMKLYFGAGMAFNDITFFDSTTAQNESSFGVNFGIIASPAFLESLQGNLYFGLEASANFMSDKTFTNAPLAANFKVNTYRLELGTEYHVNKNGVIEPFVGIGIGFASDYFNGAYDGFRNVINSGNVYYAPRAGIIFNLKNNKAIGVTVSYLSEYTGDLDFRRGEVVTKYQVNSQYLRTSLNFYF